MKYCFILFLIFFWINPSISQEIIRQTTSAAGYSGSINAGNQSLFIQSSIGQSSVIGYGTTDGRDLRQGFIQPFGSGFVRQSEFETLQVLVYPNPFSTFFNLKFEKPINGELQLFDVTGRLILNQRIEDSTEFKVEAELIPSGTYLIKVISKGASFSGQIIKLSR